MEVPDGSDTGTEQGDETGYTVMGLTNGTTYTFEVRAVNNASTGARSMQQSATPVTPPFMAYDNADGSVTVLDATMTVETGSEGYGFAGYENTATFQDGDLSPSSFRIEVTTYFVTGLYVIDDSFCTNGVSLRFKVFNPLSASLNEPRDFLKRHVLHVGSEEYSGSRAHCLASDPNWSNNDTVPVRLVWANVPDAPTGLAADAGDGAVTLSWTPPARTGGKAITGYEVRYKAGSGDHGEWTAIDDSAALTSHTVTGLTNGTAHTFEVHAVNGVGEGTGANVDGTPAASAAPPAITSVALSSDPGDDATYAIGDTVEATVTFDAAVTVSGAPQLTLDVGGTDKTAAYRIAGSTATQLVFAGRWPRATRSPTASPSPRIPLPSTGARSGRRPRTRRTRRSRTTRWWTSLGHTRWTASGRAS